MAFQEKKFLDAEGVTHLVKLLDEYPNNQILGSVIDAIEGELAEKAEKSEIPNVPVQDVQVNGVSVLNSNTANIPIASASNLGVVKTPSEKGVYVDANNDLAINPANATAIKQGTAAFTPIVPVHQEKSVFYGLAKAAGDTTQSQSDNAVGTYTADASAAIRTMLGAVGTEDYATNTQFGLVKVVSGNGIYIDGGNQALSINTATSAEIKAGSATKKALSPNRQHEAAFYGLAKASGDTTQSASSNAVGTYTDEAKAAIQAMLGIDLSSIASQVEIPLVETVTDAAVTITGQPNTRYMCGEVTSISITPPAAGSIDVVFTSGSTVAVLTLPSTVKMPEWFDASALDTNTVYEILITDGVYGSVMTWAI